MRDLAFAALFGAMVLPVLQGGAHLGVLLWTWTSLLAPNDVLFGFATAIPFTKVASGVAVLLLLAGRGGRPKFRLTATTGLFLALAFWALIAQAGGLSADTAYGWEVYQKLAKILVLALLVTAVMRDRLRVHAMLVAICLGIGFTAVQESLKWLASGTVHHIEGSSSVGDNNQVGLDVLLIVPLLAHLYGVARSALVRLGCITAGLMCFICAIATGSRGAFVGMALLAMGFVLTGRRKLLGALMVAALATVGALLLPATYFQRIDTIQTASNDDSFEGRVVAWKISLLVALNHPLFGGGMHAVQEPDVWATFAPQFDRVSFIPSAPVQPYPKAAHSIYFETLGDVGFVGCGLFVAIFLVALRNGRAVRRQVRRSGRADLAWAADLAVKLEMSLVVFLISGAALSAAYYDIEYLLAALAAVLRDIVSAETAGAGAGGRAAPRRLAPAPQAAVSGLAVAASGRPRDT